MAMGVAVVGPRMEPVLSVVGDAGVLVEPGEVRAYAQALIDLIESPKERRRLAAAGRRRSVDRYNELDLFRRMEVDYLELSRELQQTRPQHP
jgi:glycosyltransferase involved in cell wall biosynthesis